MLLLSLMAKTPLIYCLRTLFVCVCLCVLYVPVWISYFSISLVYWCNEVHWLYHDTMDIKCKLPHRVHAVSSIFHSFYPVSFCIRYYDSLLLKVIYAYESVCVCVDRNVSARLFPCSRSACRRRAVGCCRSGCSGTTATPNPSGCCCCSGCRRDPGLRRTASACQCCGCCCCAGGGGAGHGARRAHPEAGSTDRRGRDACHDSHTTTYNLATK